VADLVQQVVVGLSAGAIYALLALALVIVYRTTGVVNFAQGELATLTTYVAWQLVQEGVPYWAAFFLTLGIALAAGAAVERAVIRPFARAAVTTLVLATVALLLVIDGLLRLLWSEEVRTFPPDRPFPRDTVDIAGVVLNVQDLGVVAFTLVLVGMLAALFRSTNLGVAVRASPYVPALAWALAAGLGAVSGLFTAAAFPPLEPTMMQPILVYAIAAAVLGGLGSPVGAVVGGLSLGVFLTLVGAYSDDLEEAGFPFEIAPLRLPVAFGLIFVFLLLRPQGFFGRAVPKQA
jgi:branched-chain amino acid transport system permease protein